MKKSIQIIALLILPMLGFAQGTNDTVNTKAGSMDYFYSFDNGKVANRTAADWHVAFEISGFSSAVRINGPAGVKLYRTPYAIKDFANLDTTGMGGWDELLNSTKTWSDGAFNTDPVDDFDLGWGVYNPSTHVVSGDSVYLLMMPDKSYKKCYVEKLAGSSYYFKHADLDGSNDATGEIKKSEFSGKVFGYFNLATGKTVDNEPARTDWDILFTKYVDLIYMGPTPTPYPVSGVLINPACEVAQRDAVDVTSNDTGSLTWSKEIAVIGSDWKKFDFANNKYNITEDQAFFVRTGNGSVWKIYFTGFSGGSEGEFRFVKELVKASASVANVNLNNTVTIYPNPSSNGIFNVRSSNNELLNGEYMISDIQGRILVNGNISDLEQIDLSAQQDGLYFVTLRNGAAVAQKVIMKN